MVSNNYFKQLSKDEEAGIEIQLFSFDEYWR